MELDDAYGAWGRPATVTPARPVFDEASVTQMVNQAARNAVHSAMDRLRLMVAQEVRTQGVQVGAAVAPPSPVLVSSAPSMPYGKSFDVDKMWLAGINIALVLVLGVIGCLLVTRSTTNHSPAFMYPPFP